MYNESRITTEEYIDYTWLYNYLATLENSDNVDRQCWVKSHLLKEVAAIAGVCETHADFSLLSLYILEVCSIH